MFYVCGFNPSFQKYAVKDTKDEVVEWYTPLDLKEICEGMKIDVKGYYSEDKIFPVSCNKSGKMLYTGDRLGDFPYEYLCIPDSEAIDLDKMAATKQISYKDLAFFRTFTRARLIWCESGEIKTKGVIICNIFDEHTIAYYDCDEVVSYEEITATVMWALTSNRFNTDFRSEECKSLQVLRFPLRVLAHFNDIGAICNRLMVGHVPDANFTSNRYVEFCNTLSTEDDELLVYLTDLDVCLPAKNPHGGRTMHFSYELFHEQYYIDLTAYHQLTPRENQIIMLIERATGIDMRGLVSFKTLPIAAADNGLVYSTPAEELKKGLIYATTGITEMIAQSTGLCVKTALTAKGGYWEKSGRRVILEEYNPRSKYENLNYLFERFGSQVRDLGDSLLVTAINGVYRINKEAYGLVYGKGLTKDSKRSIVVNKFAGKEGFKVLENGDLVSISSINGVVDIPEGVIKILKGSVNLDGANEMIIPSTVKQVQSDAFNYGMLYRTPEKVPILRTNAKNIKPLITTLNVMSDGFYTISPPVKIDIQDKNRLLLISAFCCSRACRCIVQHPKGKNVNNSEIAEGIPKFWNAIFTTGDDFFNSQFSQKEWIMLLFNIIKYTPGKMCETEFELLAKAADEWGSNYLAVHDQRLLEISTWNKWHTQLLFIKYVWDFKGEELMDYCNEDGNRDLASKITSIVTIVSKVEEALNKCHNLFVKYNLLADNCIIYRNLANKLRTRTWKRMMTELGY